MFYSKRLRKKQRAKTVTKYKQIRFDLSPHVSVTAQQ